MNLIENIKIHRKISTNYRQRACKEIERSIYHINHELWMMQSLNLIILLLKYLWQKKIKAIDYDTKFYYKAIASQTYDKHCNNLNNTVMAWKPKDGEKYFYIHRSGRIFNTTFNYISERDIAMFYMGNCFRTEKEAESYKNEILQKFREVQT